VFCGAGCQHLPPRKDIPSKDILNAFEQLEMGDGDEIILNGGEPTVYRDLPLVLKAAATRQIRVYLFTNGRALHDLRYAHKLLDHGVFRLSIPIHGHLTSTHDTLTGRIGSFAQTIEGIRNAFQLQKELGTPTQIELKLLAVRPALPEWPDIVDYIVEKIGCPHHFVLSGLTMWSTATSDYGIVTPTLAELRQYLNTTLERIVKHDIPVLLWSIPLCLLSDIHIERFADQACSTSAGKTDAVQVFYFDPDYQTGIVLPSDEFRIDSIEDAYCRSCELIGRCGPGSAFYQQVQAHDGGRLAAHALRTF